MEKSGNALIGIGIGTGEGRAVEAAKQAVASPLLEANITGATSAIINVHSVIMKVKKKTESVMPCLLTISKHS